LGFRRYAFPLDGFISHRLGDYNAEGERFRVCHREEDKVRRDGPIYGEQTHWSVFCEIASPLRGSQ
jgi:hypothetical protein